MRLELMEYVCVNLPVGFSPYYIYSMLVDNVEVGRIVLREGSDVERYYDGHIGYTVFDEFQGHSYSYEGCLLLREKLSNVDHLIITCDPDNMASRRIIEKLGCKYIETVTIPHQLKKWFAEDERVKMIFYWYL